MFRKELLESIHMSRNHFGSYFLISEIKTSSASSVPYTCGKNCEYCEIADVLDKFLPEDYYFQRLTSREGLMGQAEFIGLHQNSKFWMDAYPDIISEIFERSDLFYNFNNYAFNLSQEFKETRRYDRWNGSPFNIAKIVFISNLFGESFTKRALVEIFQTNSEVNGVGFYSEIAARARAYTDGLTDLSTETLMAIYGLEAA